MALVNPFRSAPVPTPYASTETTQGWYGSIGANAAECPEPQPLDVLEGAIPAELQGTYLRNGPGELVVHGRPLKNLIDGAGFAQLVRFKGGAATLQARFVNTKTRQREERAQKALFGGFSQSAPDGLWGHLVGRSLRYPANTNLVEHGGKLFALYENDWPYRLSPTDLHTETHDDLGVLSRGQRFSAHPKFDRAGVMYGLGCTYGSKLTLRGVEATNRLSLFRRTPDGAAQCLMSTQLPYAAALVHDLALTERRAVAVVSPLVLVPTLRVILGLDPADRAVSWLPQQKSLLVTYDLKTQVTQTYAFPPALCFHLVNAFETPRGDLCVDTCDFSGGDVVRITADMMQDNPVEHHEATLYRLRLTPVGAVSKKLLMSTKLEWPRISPDYEGRPNRFIFGNTWDAHSALPDVPVRLDLKTRTTAHFPLQRPGQYAGEVLPVKKAVGRREEDVFLLCMVYEEALGSRVIHLWDGAKPGEAALCRLKPPMPMPYGFHTNWVQDATVYREGDEALA